MMNHCATYQPNNNDNNALVRGGAAAGEMMMGCGVVCPKPRRLGLLNPSLNDATRVICRSSPRWQQHQFINQAEICDSKAETEVLEMILTKGCYGAEKPNNMVPSSPPFFCGSPPSRASNPLVQDAQFGNEKPSSSPSRLSPAFEASPSSSARKSGGGNYSRGKYGQKPAAVRIEGFNCRGISATA